MSSQKAEFKFLERGFPEVLVCLPGWATDYRIFSGLNLNYNYLFALKFSPFGFKRQLLDCLRKLSVEKISLLGWSLGGFLAAEFAANYPERINQLILLGVRKKYDPKIIKELKQKLKRNKRAYLHRFYLDCFSKDDTAGLGWFRDNLLKDYLEKIKLEDLIPGLDYLKAAKIEPQSLKKIKKIRIFHAREDKIAPIEEARQIKSGLSQAEFTPVSGAGHIFFLGNKFKDGFGHG